MSGFYGKGKMRGMLCKEKESWNDSDSTTTRTLFGEYLLLEGRGAKPWWLAASSNSVKDEYNS